MTSKDLNGGELRVKVEVFEIPEGEKEKEIETRPDGIVIAKRDFTKSDTQIKNSKYVISDLSKYNLKKLRKDQKFNNKVVRISGEQLEETLNTLMKEGEEITDLGEHDE